MSRNPRHILTSNYQSGKTIGPVISERQLNTVPPKIFCGPRSTFLMKFSLLPHLDSQTFPFFHQPGSAISAGGSSSNGSRRGKTYGYRVVSHQSQVDESLFGEPQAQQMRQNMLKNKFQEPQVKKFLQDGSQLRLLTLTIYHVE